MGNLVYKVENIKRSYPIGERTVEILHGLTLEIEPGEFVMLIGPSGCGKSTFMNIMFSLDPPSEGKVLFDGEDLYAMSDNARTSIRNTRVSMVHQQSIWIKALTVRENIAFPLMLHQENAAKSHQLADQLLDVLHLSNLAHLHPQDLSIGEQQRCSFMRSLITNPEVVFADEPTGNLDTDSSIIVMELFKKINQQLGKTIIMVTHNLTHLPYATKVVTMLDGTIVQTEQKQPPAKPQSQKSIIETISNWETETKANIGNLRAKVVESIKNQK